MTEKMEDPVALTKQIVHAHYQGDDGLWLSRLCKKSVWIGTGEQVLIGGDAIREHFKVRPQRKSCQIFREEYYLLPINAQSAAVTAQVMVGKANSKNADIAASHTLVYQLTGEETKVVLTHASRGFLRALQPEQEGSILWVPAYHLYRTLLTDMPAVNRLAIPSGGKTFYIHPNTILYIHSKNRRAELFCVDAVVRSDLSIHQMNALLPEEFCSIHRCYTVNSRHVSAIRRYQVTMVTGETLPVPAQTYDRVKAELDRKITELAGTLQ